MEADSEAKPYHSPLRRYACFLLLLSFLQATVTARALAEISTPDHVAPSPRSSISSVSIAEGDNDKDPKKTSDKARVQNTGGRFLKRTPSGTNWIEVSTAEAMEKISHALRGVPRRSSLQESPTEFEASRTGSASSTGKRSTASSEFATISFSSSQKRSKSKRTPSPASAMSVSLSTPILGTGAGVTQEQLILALAQQQQQQQQIQNQLQLLLLQNQQRQQQLPLPPAAVASQQDPQRLILMQVLAQELLQPQAQQLQQQNWLQQLSLQQLLHRPNPNGDLAHLLQPLPAPPAAAAPTGSTVLSALLQNAQQQQIHPLPAATLAPALLGTPFLSQLRQQRQQSHGSSSSSEESD
jgi:hypothetical protein